jgi:hypothetical protein
LGVLVGEEPSDGCLLDTERSEEPQSHLALPGLGSAELMMGGMILCLYVRHAKLITIEMSKATEASITMQGDGWLPHHLQGLHVVR